MEQNKKEEIKLKLREISPVEAFQKLIVNLMRRQYGEENKILLKIVENSLKDLKELKNNPLKGIQDWNHFRNLFYNAPIGTIEHDIANRLNDYVVLRNDVKKYFDLTYRSKNNDDLEELKNVFDKLLKVGEIICDVPEVMEWRELHNKLSKVGKNDDK